MDWNAIKQIANDKHYDIHPHVREALIEAVKQATEIERLNAEIGRLEGRIEGMKLLAEVNTALDAAEKAGE